jgi:antitoxin (DNA-binding transcriptional repressor) of toxin-antitoxin stability system
MLEAKTHLSKPVDSLESGRETDIIIARNGRPAARLVPLRQPPTGKRIGIAEGRWVIPDDIDQDNDLIADLFEGKAT